MIRLLVNVTESRMREVDLLVGVEDLLQVLLRAGQVPRVELDVGRVVEVDHAVMLPWPATGS